MPKTPDTAQVAAPKPVDLEAERRAVLAAQEIANYDRAHRPAKPAEE